MRHSLRILCFMLLSASFISCAHRSPEASMGDFTDQVIEPLASRMAEEKFTAQRAALIAASTPKPARTTAKNLLSIVPMLGTLFQLEDKTHKAQLEADLAWLETRRLPLKQELRELLVERTVKTDEGFAFCVDGRQRRYRIVEGARFSRLADGSELCAITELHSLTRPARTD